AAQGFAASLHGAAEDHAIGPREIYVLEDAAGLLHLSREEARRDAVRIHHDHLARLDVALEHGANQIERAGLRSKHDGVALRASAVADASHGERAEAARVAHGKNAVASH